MDWYAFHAWCHSIDAQERLAVHLFCENQLDVDWFFVKYWMGGPHLRVRTTTRAVHEALVREARNWLDHAAVPSLDRDRFYSGVSLFGEEVDDVDGLPWFPSGTVLEMPYEPELDRYLGIHHMAASERAFRHSSEFAVSVFTSPHPRSIRLALGALALWGMAKAYGLATIEFFQRYAEFWEQVAGGADAVLPAQAATAICERVVSGQAQFAAVDRYVTAMTAELAPVVADVTPNEATLLIASHMHMTNNRLSVLPATEAALASGFCRVLERNHS